MAVAQLYIDKRGLTGWVDPIKVSSGDLIQATNVDFSYGGLLQKEGGTLKINASALSGSPTVLAGFDYWPTPSIQRRVIATSDGKLYKDDMTGTFGTTLKSGLVVSSLTQIVEAGAESQGRTKKLFFVNGMDPVQVLSGDGITTSNIGALAPSDWTSTNQPTFLVRFRASLAGGGNINDPHRLYISTATDHEDFSGGAGGLSLSVFPGEGQRLVAGLSALGRVFLWKYPTGVYYVANDDIASGNWTIRRITGQYGAVASPHSVCQIDQGTIAFLSAAGELILMQETSGSLLGVEFINLTKDLGLRTFVRDNFNLGRLEKSQLRWYTDKLQLHILLCATGSTTEDRRLIIDFAGERARVHMSTKDKNNSIWMELDTDHIPRPIIGDNIGFVRKIDQTDRSLETVTPYQMVVHTVPTDFSDLDSGYAVKKLFYRLHLEYETTGNYDVAAEIFIDNQSKGTVFFNQGSPGSILPFQLPGVLGGADIKRRTRAIAGEGYTFSVRFNEATIHNPRIARAFVEFEPLELAL